MARLRGDDDDYHRRREREERAAEEAQEAAREAERKAVSKGGLRLIQGGAGAGPVTVEQIDAHIHKADALVGQVDSLYKQYIVGVESRPPLELRKQLDMAITSLQAAPKPTPSYNFRFQNLNQKYLTHRDRWDKMIKDLESGKIQRTAGPKKGPGSGKKLF